MATTDLVLYSDDVPILEALADELKLSAGDGHPNPVRRAFDVVHARYGHAALAPLEELLARRLSATVTTLAAGASTRPRHADTEELARRAGDGGANS